MGWQSAGYDQRYHTWDEQKNRGAHAGIENLCLGVVTTCASFCKASPTFTVLLVDLWVRERRNPWRPTVELPTRLERK